MTSRRLRCSMSLLYQTWLKRLIGTRSQLILTTGGRNTLQNRWGEKNRFDIYKLAGPDKIHPKSTSASSWSNLRTISNYLWRTGELTEDWRRANLVLSLKSGTERTSGIRPISLTLIPEKILEQIVKPSLFNNHEDNRVIRNSHHGFIKNKSC